MKIRQLQEIIDHARLVHADELGDFVHRALELDEPEASRAVEYVRSVIDGIPALLAEASTASEVRGVGLVVQPLLEHAAEYFIDPVDHASELAFGVPGLLDDAYLALRLIHLVQEVYQPLVHADVAGQLEFLRRLLGPELVYEMDAEAGRAVLRMALHIAAVRKPD